MGVSQLCKVINVPLSVPLAQSPHDCKFSFLRALLVWARIEVLRREFFAVLLDWRSVAVWPLGVDIRDQKSARQRRGHVMGRWPAADLQRVM